MTSTTEPVTSHDRARAIADGSLVNVSLTAVEVGFQIPVAVTRAVFEDAVYWEAEDQARKPAAAPTNAYNRLVTLLVAAWFATARANGHGPEVIPFDVVRVPRAGRGWVPRKTSLVAVIGPGDDGRTVITIKREDEA